MTTEDTDLRIAKLKLKAGEVLVVKFASLVSVEAALHAEKYIGERLPKDVHVLVIDSAIADLSVLTVEEIARRAKRATAG